MWKIGVGENCEHEVDYSLEGVGPVSKSWMLTVMVMVVGR